MWGCSSGRLRRNGIHDPQGTALCYLAAGAPFVVGNLWDVTDVDIDKFSIQCMGFLLCSEKDSDLRRVPCALIESRGVCKLKRAVGFAPVIYGLPSFINSSPN